MLQDGYLVERIGIDCKFPVACGDAQQGAFFCDESVLAQAVERLFDVVGRDVGQEAEPSRIDAQNRDLTGADASCRAEERPVSAYGNGNVRLKRFRGKCVVGANVDAQRARNEVGERFFKANVEIQLGELL